MDKVRILVTEDEGIIAKDLENTLKGMGYEVCAVASSGEEAVRKAEETRPDVALMDVVLRGGMDGVEAAERIRSRLGIPVIFLTAYADETTLQRAKMSGPFGYMLKPFEERELRGAIEVALDRHEMEKKLKKSAEEWRSTFDSIQDWVSVHDRDFRIVRVNRAMAEAFRRPPQDMIGETCYQVIHRSNEPIPPCPHRRALETRRPAREEIFDPGLGIHLEISASPILDEKGELTGTVHIAKDISERKKAEGALRKSEERFRRLFEGIPIGLYRSTPGGKLIEANPALARLFGYPDADSFLRKDMADTYVDPRDRLRFKALMKEKGWAEQFRVERRRRDGSRIWVETNSHAVRGPDGAVQCYEGSVQDVSDRQAFEEELGRNEYQARQLAFEKSMLAEIGRIISSTTDIEEVYKSFAGEVKKFLPFDRLIVTLVERGKGTMINRFVEGTSAPGRNVGEVFPLRGTFGEAVIESRRGILLQMESEEDTIKRYPGLLPEIRAGMKSGVSVPLFYRDEAVGVLHIFSTKSKAYREKDLVIARSIADQIAGAVINGQLFSDLKEASKSMAESEELHRVIMDSAGRAGEGVIILQDQEEKEAACIFANEQAARITGYTEEELRQRSWMEIVHPSSLPSVRDRYRRRVSGEDLPGLFEISFGHKTGREVSVEVIASPARIQGKAVLITFFRDITDRKEMERDLAQAHRLEAVGQLAAGIAHEINTPTQYVGDNARFLQEGFRDLNEVLAKYGRLLAAVKSGQDGIQAAREVEEAVRKVDLPYLTGEIPRAISQSLEGVERVTKIVRAMKEFSHPGVKEKTLVDINKAIENTVTVSRNEWKYVADLSADLDPSLPPVPCHLGEFNQVILNIVVNAAHAIADVVGDGSGGKGTIRVATRREKDWVEVRISDTGGGIPESIRSRIFDPFFTTKAVGKGTGQGLAIAHSVVVGKHGGTIHFETETGKGTTFIIRLPIAPKEREQGSEE